MGGGGCARCGIGVNKLVGLFLNIANNFNDKFRKRFKIVSAFTTNADCVWVHCRAYPLNDIQKVAIGIL